MVDGKLLLPSISPSSRTADLKAVCSSVAKKLGPAGKMALADYVKESGLREDHEVWPLLEAAFISSRAPRSKRKHQ